MSASMTTYTPRDLLRDLRAYQTETAETQMADGVTYGQNHSKTRGQAIIIGGAIIDMVMTVSRLPHSGDDVLATPVETQVGGCALNAARTIHALGQNLVPAIPVGVGTWSGAVEAAINEMGYEVLIRNPHCDNAWCLALVEPSKERTFISTEGPEVIWDRETLDLISVSSDDIVYLSGYELLSQAHPILFEWMRDKLNDNEPPRLVLDIGPRILDAPLELWLELLTPRTILTINEDEFTHADNVLRAIDGHGLDELCEKRGATLLHRQGSHGTIVSVPHTSDGRTTSTKTQVKRVNVTLCDTIGAGDTHTGGVIAGLLMGMSEVEATALGNTAAGLVCTQPGVSYIPTLCDIVEFLGV